MTQTTKRMIPWAACLLALLAPPAFSAAAGEPGDRGLCQPGEKVWFSAEAAESDRLVSLCGADKVNDRIAWLQFRMGVPGKLAMAWPEQRKGSTKAFTYRRYTRYRVSLEKLGFQIDGREYAILDNHVSEDKPVTNLSFRVRRLSDETVLETHKLNPDTQEGSLLRLEHYVPTRDYDE